MDLARANYYRAKSAKEKPTTKRRSHRRLSEAECERVIDVLISDGYCDKSVRQVWAELIDTGIYYCSVRTMYRILARKAAVRERRDQLRHPEYTRPELLATGPNQLWSWDITKLKGPHKWTYYYLYVLMDVCSRKVVGWMVAERESSTLAVELIRQSCEREGISRDRADRSRGSRLIDALETGGLFAGGSRRDENALEAVHEYGQSVLGGAVQDVEVSTGVPGAFWVTRRRACVPSGLTLTGTTMFTATAVSDW